MTFENRRVWLIGGIVAAIVLAAIAYLAVISPKLSAAASLRDQTASVEQQNSVLQAKVRQLKKENENVGTLRASLTDVLAQLPTSSGLPAFTRQLTGQATQNHVSLTSITVGSISKTTPAGTAPTTSSTGNTFAIQVTVVSTGTASDQLAFLHAIQVTGPRRVLVASTQLMPLPGSEAGSIDGGATMTTQLTAFSAPMTPQQQAQVEKLLSGDVSTQ